MEGEDVSIEGICSQPGEGGIDDGPSRRNSKIELDLAVRALQMARKMTPASPHALNNFSNSKGRCDIACAGSLGEGTHAAKVVFHEW